MNRVIVPLDGSDTSEAAVPHGARLAATLGVPLLLVHVVDTGHVYDARALAMLPDRTEMERYLGDVAVREGIEANVEIDVRYGSPAYELTQVTKEYGNGIVVMSTHGRGGLSRAVFGSVTDRLIRNDIAPVMTIRAGSVRAPKDGYANLLVTLDGSELAANAVPIAAKLARKSGATIHLLRVVEPLDVAPASEYPPDTTWLEPGETAQIMSDREADARIEVSDTATALRTLGLKVQTMVRIGRAASEILQAATDTDADLLLMATHGRGGLRRMLMGSVTTTVAQNATVPLLVIPPMVSARAPRGVRRETMVSAPI